MFVKQLLFVFLCVCYINLTYQIKYPNFDENKSTGTTQIVAPKSERPHLTSIIIIVVCVIVLIIILWGSRIFYIIKMHFFERAKRLYTKMDLTSEV